MEKLSPEMQKCIDMLNKHGKLIRYEGGFWAEENAKMKTMFNGNKDMGLYPIDNIGTNTIKALLSRNMIIAIDFQKGWHNIEFPVGVVLRDGKIPARDKK